MGNRARKARGLKKPADVPLDRARAVAKFTRLKGRSVEINLVPSGVIVAAGTPAELESATNEEFARRAGRDRN
jgi:hypothetical protein